MFHRASLCSGLLVLIACADQHPTTEQLLVNHGDSAADIKGLMRESAEGPFFEGAVEEFRAVFEGAEAAKVQWSASSGALSTRGAHATWTLPHAGGAELSLVATLNDGREVSASWSFEVMEQPRATSRSAHDALLATPMPVIDGGTSIEITGGACTLEYDSTGAVQVAFTSSTHPGLYYGKWNGSTWSIEVVDGMGFNVGGDVLPAYVSMAVDPSNTPHIAYVVKGTIGYATKSGGVWLRERADTTGVPAYTSGANGAYVAIALNPAQGYRPTIVYRSMSGSYLRVGISTRTAANTWTVVTPLVNPGTVTSYYDQYSLGDVTFDTAGTLYLPVFVDAYPYANSGDYLVSWTASATAVKSVTVAGTPGWDTTSTSFAWASPTRLVARTSMGVWDVGLAAPFTNSTVAWSRNETTGGSYVGDLAWGQNKPSVLHQHGSVLELVTPNSGGYWTYTQLGSTSGASASLALQPTTGTASICYQLNGRLMFQ